MFIFFDENLREIKLSKKEKARILMKALKEINKKSLIEKVIGGQKYNCVLINKIWVCVKDDEESLKKEMDTKLSIIKNKKPSLYQKIKNLIR